MPGCVYAENLYYQAFGWDVMRVSQGYWDIFVSTDGKYEVYFSG